MVRVFDYDRLSSGYFKKFRDLSIKKNDTCKGDEMGYNICVIFSHLDHYAFSSLKKTRRLASQGHSFALLNLKNATLCGYCLYPSYDYLRI